MNQWDNKTTIERFLDKISIDIKTGCWNWIGAKYKNGYGAFAIDRRTNCAHRHAYELFIGPIPDKYEIHHKCKNISCVNPKHLSPITRLDHLKEDNIDIGAWQLAKTHCPRGHEYTKDNLKKVPRGRTCLTCHRNKNREYMRKKRGSL